MWHPRGVRPPLRPSRRRLAFAVLAALAFVHLLAFAAYELRDRQSHLLLMYLDARDQWREGHLDVAAAEYAAFIARRDSIVWPVALLPNMPDAANAWYLLGRVQTDAKRVDAALEAFERGMALDPGRGRREYRDLLLTSGRPAKLEAFARAEAAADPRSPLAQKDLGAALLALGRPAEAAAAYRQALALLPAWRAGVDPAAPAGLSGEEADLLNLLSVAALRAGDAAAADEACRRATTPVTARVRLDPLCSAYREAAAGDLEAARHTLAGYVPPAPEHDALVRALVPDP